MPQHNDLLLIDGLVCLKVVDRAAEPPSPSGNRSPFVVRRLRLIAAIEQRVDTVLKSVVKVGVDIAIVDRCQAVASLENRLNRPAAGAGPPRLLSGPVVDNSRATRPHPGPGQLDLRVAMDRVVSGEIQSQKDRRRTDRGGGQIDQEIHLRSIPVRRKVDRHLSADRPATQCSLVPFRDLKLHVGARLGAATVYLGREQIQNLAAPLLGPSLGIHHALTAVESQRIG